MTKKLIGFIEKKRKENQFDVSDGNIKVLETIPKMMANEKYRKELRKLTLNYIFDAEIKRGK